MKQSLLGAALAVALTMASAAQQIPRPAGPWTAQTLDKKVISLSQYHGKYVLVAFLLTT